MATLKQIEANRANAKKSTGPKTAEGKDASSCNALRHGLLSTRTIVGNEDASEFKALRDGLLADYQPANTQELLLVDRIANAAWRTLRVRQMEQHLADMSIDTWQAKRKHIKTRTAKTDTEALTISMVEDDLWRVMQRYDTQIAKDFFRSVETLRRLQNDRLKQERQRPQPQQTTTVAQPNWVPLEKTLTATGSAQAERTTEACATLKANKNASPYYAGTGERNDSPSNISIPGSGPDCELFHS